MKELKNVLLKIEASKIKIANERDILRTIFDELEMILGACDEGIEGLEGGKREIENAIDTMSQYL